MGRYRALGAAVPGVGTWKALTNSPLGLLLRAYLKVLLFGGEQSTRKPDVALAALVLGRDISVKTTDLEARERASLPLGLREEFGVRGT